MKLYTFVLLTTLLLAGCGNKTTTNLQAPKAPSDALVFINVTSDVAKKPQAIDMALKLGRFSLDEGRKVFYFFNVKAVHIPCKSLDAKLAFKGQDPIKQQLEKLIKDGAVVHVCPICMKALGVDKKDILAGSQVTTRSGLFAKIKSDTAVFTY